MNRSRGVAPVIGTILVVAVVVVIATITGYYTLVTLDRLENPPPQAVINSVQDKGSVVSPSDFNDSEPNNQNNISVTFTHASGSMIAKDRLSVDVNGYDAYDVYSNKSWETLGRNPIQSNLSAGNSFRVVVYGSVDTDGSETETPSHFHNTGTLDEDVRTSNQNEMANELRTGDVVRIRWTSPSGLNSYILEEVTIK